MFFRNALLGRKSKLLSSSDIINRLFCRFQQTFGKPVLTPVRRSIRLERISSQHPSLLREHDLTVTRLSELPEDIQQNLFFKPNFAVPAELNEAWRKLQLDFTE